MFHMSYTAPAPSAGTITFEVRPAWLGVHTDVDGKRWDVRGIFPGFVQACPVDTLHPHYKSTAGGDYWLVTQDWQPYEVEVQP